MPRKPLLIASFLFFITSTSSYAASLVGICRNTSKAASECSSSRLFFPTYPVSGGSAEFLYKIDQGSIGDIGENQARTLAESMLTLWEDVSSIDFVRKGNGLLDEDIDSNNFIPVLEPSTTLGFSAVVWDDDGQITEELFGRGSSDSVLGFAGPTFLNTTSNTIESIAESQSVFNGLLFRGANTGDSQSQILSTFQTTILHEFAHMFGIDHTQGGNIDDYNNFTGDLKDIPVMFPAAANPDVGLLQDDIAAVKIGYPLNTDSNNFGSISGSLNQSGVAVEGANVIAFKIDDDNPRLNAVASPSDVDGQGFGNFELPSLLPGNYILRAEAIDSSFTGGSAVGIHSPISSSAITEGFYSGDNSAVLETDNLTNAAANAFVISVSAGSNTNINFDLNASATNDNNNDNDSDNSNNDNGDDTSFSISGGAFNNVIFLRNKRTRKRFRINREGQGQRNISISSDYPDLISFRPGDTVSFSKKRRRMRIVLESFNEFLETFPNLEEDGGVEIPITFTDNDTGYVDNGNSIFVF